MTSKSKSPSTGKLPATYEAALAELEALVQTLESGQTPLDDLLANYQRGTALLAFCREKLSAVEAQIRILEAPATAGAPETTRPWQERGE